MTDHPYQTLSSRTIWNSPWFILREDRIRLPDQSLGVYNVIERPGAVWVVPVLADGRLVLIRNYRYAIDRWLWEVPAGSVDHALPVEENARRELSEEVGGTADSLELLGEMYTAPGISDEKGYYFLARGVTLGEPNHEPTEVMERHILSVSQVEEMLRRGEVNDAPSALALMLSMPRLGK